MPAAPKKDNFLKDAVKPERAAKVRHITYGDGFRFGMGMMIAGLFVSVVVGGLAWALIAAFKLG
jgi:hypothetical protein